MSVKSALVNGLNEEKMKRKRRKIITNLSFVSEIFVTKYVDF